MSITPLTRRIRLALAGAVAAALTAVALAVPVAPAAAADASDFNAGYLISDAAFFNGTAMSATEVYSFLTTLNSGCAAGATCILNYKHDIKAMPADPMCNAVTFEESKSAARAIYVAGKACGVSQKALMVILQKEQSLITAKSPTTRALNYAMGYGCPDTAPCDPAYAGLFTQIYKAAWAMKRYTMPAGTGAGTDYPVDYGSRYKAGATSNILYSPKSGCGTKSVYVANQATHALYIYTPYTPNAAALKNLYGTGDACSSYGNRNFWRMYTDWYGPTGEIGVMASLELYGELGGSTGVLGAAEGAVVRDTVNAGIYQQYAGGIITWTAKIGAQVILAPFDAAWIKAGAANGLGWPTADTVKSTAAGGGMTQVFQNGMFAKAAGKSTFTLSAAMRDGYVKNKGPAGPLSWPTAAATTSPSGTPMQKFQGGSLFASGANSGYIAPPLEAAYLAMGDVTSTLKWPSGPFVTSTVGNGGGSQAFTGGTLFNSTDHGIHAVFGWMATGLAKFGGIDAVGWPTSDRVLDAPTNTWTQTFENGSIFTDGKTYALMNDEFLAAARTHGFITGNLGWPLTAAQQTDVAPGGLFQEFDGGMFAKPSGGSTYYMYSTFRTAFNDTGKFSGKLGWPTSNRYTDTKVGLSAQDFAKGTLFVKGPTYGLVGTNFVALARARGVATGALGWPTSGVGTSSVKGGGQYEVFSGGTLTWQSDNGALYVPTTIWTAQRKAGGFAGALGWPTAAATYNSKTATITQTFDGGTITWNKTKGAVVTLTPTAKATSTP